MGCFRHNPNLPGEPIVFANDGFYEMTQYLPGEVLGRNCRFLQGPGTNPATVQRIRDALAESSAFHGMLINYEKDGAEFVNELIINPVFDKDGNLANFVGLQNEVTEREKSRELLEVRVRERTEDLAQSRIEILSRLARAAEFRDDDTGQHTQREARTSALLAEGLGLPADQVALIGMPRHCMTWEKSVFRISSC